MAIMSPGYNELVYGGPKSLLTDTLEGKGWGPKELKTNQTVEVYSKDNKMEWRGEAFLTCGNKDLINDHFRSRFPCSLNIIFSFPLGVLSFALAIILGITSLPSVTASMTWKEFAFVQSKLGWICLLLACAHNLFYGWPYINTPSCHIPSSFQVYTFTYIVH